MSELRLKEFIGQIKNGGMAKANQYYVEVAAPPALGQSDPFKSNLRTISLFCDKAEIPGVTIESAPVRSYGESREVAYGKIYDQVQLTFYVDANFLVKEFFDAWINSVYDTETRHIGYPKDYSASEFKIFVEDSKNQSRYTVTLHNVYPKNVGSIEVGYATNGIMKLNVTLTYQWSTFERYGPAEFKKASFIDSIKANGLIGAASAGIGDSFSKFNYGFDKTPSIPQDYFSQFSSFQSTVNGPSENVNISEIYEDVDGSSGE